MASKLVRLSRNISKLNLCSSIRQISMVSNGKFIKNNTLLEPILINSFTKLSLFKNNFASSSEKPTRSQLEERVLDLLRQFDRIKENPSKPDVKLDSHLTKDLGLDSLDHVEIIVQLEDAFGYEIPDSDYEKLLTPNEIVNYLEKRLVEV